MKNSCFYVNLKKLADVYSQRKLASDIGVSAASINNYLQGVSVPSLSFLTKLKKAYGIDIDDFLYSDIDFSEQSIEKNSDKYIGNYMIYYFDSSAYKGRVSSFADSTLSYGVISVTNNVLEKMPVVKAVFYRSRGDAQNLHQKLNTGEKNIDMEENVYIGGLNHTDNHLFFSLHSKDGNDQTLFIFNNPPTVNNYVGGIGTVNSVSRGREHMPCAQYVIISRQPVKAPDGLIYNALTLQAPNLDVKAEAQHLISLFKSVYIEMEQSSEKLTDYQKDKIIADSLKSMVSDMIEQNMFRFAKISEMEDDECYRMIREYIYE